MSTQPILTRIICVVPSYNRLDALKKCLLAIDNQTRKPDHVLIIDNHSTDATPEWLAGLSSSRHDITIVRTEHNCGGAGAYHIGIKKAYQMDAMWIWTLDDDAIPEPGALAALLEYAVPSSGKNEPETGLLASEVLWKNGDPHIMNIPGFSGYAASSSELRGITHASFVSILINRRAIQSVGYPIKEFFIHSDDVEYTGRIVSKGFRAFLVAKSRVLHMTPDNKGITLASLSQIDPQHPAKAYYTLRNLVAINRRRPLGWLREPARICIIAASLVQSEIPLRTKLDLIKAGFQGLFMQYEKWIEYPADGTGQQRA